MNDSLDLPPNAAVSETGAPISFSELFITFFHIGSTTFGGMWAATQKLDEILVHKKAWITEDELQMLMVAGTVIPSPKFLSFAALVGYRLRGWWGSVVAVMAILAPGALLVLAGAALLNPKTVGAALVQVNAAVQIGVVGLLLGNAYHQLKGAKTKGRSKLIGSAIAVAVAVATMAGAPLIVSALAGIVLGVLVLRPKHAEAK